jgi:precorrin-6A/cobalt-precorrin-6A reductase
MPGPEACARRLLILGGTGEARALAEGAAKAFPGRLDVVSSLAGRLSKPPVLPGGVRVGGFGGAAGLARYLAAESIHMVVDATHPFAQVISANAARACADAGVARLVLVRPASPRPEGLRWIEADDLAHAARLLPPSARRVFLAAGRRGLEAFSQATGVNFLVRLVEAPDGPLPLPEYTVVTGRPAESKADEMQLLRDHAIDAMVIKDSGGGEAKIAAARELDVTVVAVRRPAPPTGESRATVDEVLAWIEDKLGRGQNS